MRGAQHTTFNRTETTAPILKGYTQGRIDRTIPLRVSLDEGLDVGEDIGTPVALTYDVPFTFTGKLAKVTIDLKGGGK